jgi:putative IMPACT (imprinted ancient) family translation regulator
MQSVALTIDYKQMDLLSRALLNCSGSIVSKSFDAQINLVVSLPVEEVKSFLNRFKPYGE